MNSSFYATFIKLGNTIYFRDKFNLDILNNLIENTQPLFTSTRATKTTIQNK